MKLAAESIHHLDAKKIYGEHMRQVSIRVDRVFFFVLLFEWAASFLIGLVFSPVTWLGEGRRAFETASIGLFFGALFAVPPLILVKIKPGEKITRYAVAFAQVCFAILFIYLTGGRIESHFHIFVSLAALAFYRDRHIIWAFASLIIIDHLIRGYYVPMTIYGESAGMGWRWLEHSSWVVLQGIIMSAGIQYIREQDMQVSESRYILSEAERMAQKASSLKTNYLSEMSHEIRTPLNSILGFAEILRETKLDKDQMVYVETINRCSDALKHLIDGVLDISKIETGALTVDRHKFDLQKLHEDIRCIFSAQCVEKNLLFEIEMNDFAQSEFIGDSHKIKQVLMNLVSNAIKFTDSGSVLLIVNGDPATNRVQWLVKDTGRGIRSENIESLFSRFQQEDPSISRMYGGTGLGLRISKSLVEFMGGQISVESEFGEGSIFKFSLPLDRA